MKRHRGPDASAGRAVFLTGIKSSLARAKRPSCKRPPVQARGHGLRRGGSSRLSDTSSWQPGLPAQGQEPAPARLPVLWLPGLCRSSGKP